MHIGLPALLIVTTAAAAGQATATQEDGSGRTASAAGQASAPMRDTLFGGLDLGRSTITYPGGTLDQVWEVTGAKATFHPARPLAKATCESAARDKIQLLVPVGRPGALGARTIRVTVVWSILKSGWAEGAVAVTDRERVARADNRPTQRPAAGRRLSLDLPADRILRAGNLAVDVHIAARCRKNGSASLHVDALELEVRG